MEVIKAVPENWEEKNTLTISVFDIGYQRRDVFEGYSKIVETGKKIYKSITSVDKEFSKESLKPLEDLLGDMTEAYDEINDLVSQDMSSIIQKLMDMINKKIENINEPKIIEKNLLYDIVIPAPNVVIDSFGHSYTMSEISPTDIMYKSALSSVASTVVPGLAGAMKSAIDYDVKIAQRNNYTTNLNIVNAYQGTNLREFNFSITFMFRSSKEVPNVFKAIMLFKKHSSAIQDDYMNNAYLAMSSIFKFSFGSDKYNNIIDIKNNESSYFFLTNIRTTLGEGQNYINKFDDGTPKKITVDLSFRSRQPDYIPFDDKSE